MKRCIRIRWRVNDRRLKGEIRRRLGVLDDGETVNGFCRWLVDERQLGNIRLIAEEPYNYLQIMELR